MEPHVNGSLGIIYSGARVCAYHNKKCEVDLNETRLKFTANNYTQGQEHQKHILFPVG